MASIIDWHCHVHPPTENEAARWESRSPLSVENLLKIHEDSGIERCVVTDTIHYLKGRSPAECLDALKIWHDYAAELADTYRGRLTTFASAIPGGGPKLLAEVERALDDLGLAGVFINSSFEGHYPDEDEATPFFELVHDRGVPVFVHAPDSSFGTEYMNMYRLISSIGRPMDECLSIARLIVRGVLERFPGLKLVGAHLGGGISEVIARMDYAYELRDEAFFLGPYQPVLISKKPSEYLTDMYFDTATYHLPAIICALSTIGADRLVFGSDAPPLSSLLPRMQPLIEALPITGEERQMIFSGTAENLLSAAGARGRRSEG